jgi:hypothetical protein
MELRGVRIILYSVSRNSLIVQQSGAFLQEGNVGRTK